MPRLSVARWAAKQSSIASFAKLRLNGRVQRSEEVVLLLGPRVGYRALASQQRPHAWRSIVRRALILLFAIGLAVSCSVTREPRLEHVLLSAAAWAFVPIIQLASTCVLGLALRRRDLASLCDLSFAGNGPHVVSATLIALLSCFELDGALLRYGPVVGVAMLGQLYGGLLAWAFAREVLKLTPARALMALLAEWLLRVLLLIGWYGLMNNLLPQALGIRS